MNTLHWIGVCIFGLLMSSWMYMDVYDRDMPIFDKIVAIISSGTVGALMGPAILSVFAILAQNENDLVRNLY